VYWIVVLTGCGHQGFFYMTGKGLNLGYNPNSNELGIQYRNGESIGALNKENAKVTLESEDVLDGTGKVTAKKTKITYELGETATGYDVDLKKAENNKDEN
jgi:hypothetical protein